jgi:GT2 family glycosyltransferase
MHDLSIVIVSWNTKDFLQQCLYSIHQYPPKVLYEIIVVDNQSNDGSVDLVKLLYPDVRLIANSTNGGFARGNNQAIAASDGNFILLLNPDTEVEDGAIDRLHDLIDADDTIGAVGSRLINPDHTIQASCHPEPTLLREFWRLFHFDRVYRYGDYDMTHWPMNQVREVEVVQGASMMVRRTVINEIGLFDDGYFMYTEEVDLCHRIRKNGKRIVFVPQSIVVHYGGKSTQQVAQQMFIRLYESRLRYFRKNHGKSQAMIYRFILIAAAAIRVLFSPFIVFFSRRTRSRYQVLAQYYRELLVEIPKMELE